jgi:GDP-L-fucose synthase
MIITNNPIGKLARIYVAGHRGMVGSAIVRRLQAGDYANILTRTHADLDLTNQSAVSEFFLKQKPDYVFMAAAKVGGIHANNSCRAGPLEQTNEPYAIAKIAGIKLCESYNRQYNTQFVSVMPTNLYGPNDNYDLNNSHVLPALIRKAHEAKVRSDKELVVWGTGKPMREFLYVDDMADACIFMMENGVADGMFNVGTGKDVTIRELAETVMSVVGFKGEIVFNTSKPDGTPRKLLNVDRMRALGWQAKTELREGIAKAYKDFTTHVRQ